MKLLVFCIASVLLVHVAAQDLGPPATGFRSLDGRDNHSNGKGGYLHPYDFIQTSSAYGDQISTPAGNSRPLARSISNALFGATPTLANTELSDFLAYFGQFIAHDIALTESSDNETMPVPVSTCEVVENRVDCSGMIQFNFSRALATQSHPFDPRRVVNFQTSFIDGSLIYGPNNETSALLRTFTQGLLKTERNNVTNEEMLPFANNMTTFQLMQSARVTNTTQLFLAGDPRANVQPALQAIHTLFVREHNRRALYLQAQSTTPLSDEQLFQRARAWVIALLQQITYTQYLPTLLGTTLPSYQGYDVTKDPSLDHFFVGAAFRYGHSAISPLILRLDETGEPIPQGHLLLRDHFFRTDALIQSNGSIDSILRGLTFQADQLIDTIITDELRNFFTDKPYDLGSLNIMRGRDFGLPSYVDVRSAFGLDVPTSFEEMSTTADIQQQLASVYSDVSQVDAYVGGLSEEHATPSHLGPLFTASLIEQFLRLRDADRFWYERENVLQPGELQELSNWDLGRVVKENTNIQVYPSNPFVIYRQAFTSTTNNNTNSNAAVITIPLVANVLTLSVQAVSDSQLAFQLCASFSGGWMAIGFNPSALQMTGSDIIMARQINGQWQVQDYYATGEIVPNLDTQQSVTNVVDATSVCGTNQGVSFRRLANTGDTNDVVIVKDGQVNLIYAYVPSVTNFDYHGPTMRGGIQTVLWSSSSSTNAMSTLASDDSVNVLYYHGVIMFITFSIIYPLAIYLIRYMTSISARYVLVHRLFMSFGSMAAVLGVASVFAVKGSNYLQTRPHALFGLILFCHMLLNLILGSLTMQHWAFVRRNQRWIRFIHRINGWILFFGGWVNSVLGLIDLGAGNLVYGYIVWLVLILLVFLVLGEFGLMKKFYAWYLTKCQMASSTGSVSGTGKKSGKKAVIGFSWSEVNDRVAQGAQWLVISGNIYEVGEFIEQHPGGKQLIQESIGTDATRSFYGTISATQDFVNEDVTGLLGFIPKQLTRRSHATTETKAETPRLNARPKNLHSNVAMHRLHSMFIGRVKDYDEGDEDDLMSLVNQTLGKQDFITQQKRMLSQISGSQSQSNLSPVESRHVARRQQASNDLLDDQEFKLFSSKTMTLGLKENYYRNLRLLSKSLVVKQEAHDKVYRFRFAFERPSHAVVTIPGDCFEFLIFDEGRAVSRFYTPIHVKQIGHLDLIIKVYEKGKMSGALNRLVPGDVIRVRGPVFHKAQLNSQTLSGCYHRVALIAAGSGLTPMLLIMEYYQRMKRILESEGVKSSSAEMPQELVLITMQHSVNDLILDKELDQMAADSDGFIHIVKCVSQTPCDSDSFDGNVGRLDESLLRDNIPFLPNTTAVGPANVTRRLSLAPTAEVSRRTSNESGTAAYSRRSSTVEKQALISDTIRAIPLLGKSEFVITESPLETTKTNTSHDYHLFVCGPVSFNESVKEMLVKQLGFDEEDVTVL